MIFLFTPWAPHSNLPYVIHLYLNLVLRFFILWACFKPTWWLSISVSSVAAAGARYTYRNSEGNSCRRLYKQSQFAASHKGRAIWIRSSGWSCLETTLVSERYRTFRTLDKIYPSLIRIRHYDQAFVTSLSWLCSSSRLGGYP